MRNAFVSTLVELADRDEKVFLLTADLGWSVLEAFAKKHPARFLNVGVAEQNMAGIATGLAMAGYRPYIYSIATFTSMRCYEQVRNGPILHGLPVRVVGIGGGYAYGHAGPTHYALEDLAIARAQPAMTVVAPADPAQTAEVLRVADALPGPVYLRIGKGGNPEIPGLKGRFALGRPELVKDGKDVLFIATGAIAGAAVAAAERLEASGVSAGVAVMAHLPFEPSAALGALLQGRRAVVALEEGYAAGGLGSLVAETIATRGLDCRLKILGVRAAFTGRSGDAAYMQKHSGLGPEAAAEAAASLLKEAVSG